MNVIARPVRYLLLPLLFLITLGLVVSCVGGRPSSETAAPDSTVPGTESGTEPGTEPSSETADNPPDESKAASETDAVSGDEPVSEPLPDTDAPTDSEPSAPETAAETVAETVIETVSAPVTAVPETRNPETVAPVTTPPVTAAPVTAPPVTSTPMTTPPVTSAPVTTPPETAAPDTTLPGAVSVPVDPGDVTSIVLIRPDTYLGSPYDVNDVTRLVVCLQGLLNGRAESTGTFYYLLHDSSDTFWLDYLRRDGKLLCAAKETEIASFTAFWNLVKPYAAEFGIVLWDPAVPATANVASTICSVDRYLPVKYEPEGNTLYNFLLSEGVEVKQSLVGLFEDAAVGKMIADTSLFSSGSSKCDAYLWALKKYMDRCSSSMIAYVLDGASTVPSNPIYQRYGAPGPDVNQLFNHDYLIMNRCFFFDLSVVGDEAPCDDPGQPIGTDLATAKKILKRMYERSGGSIVQCIGFPMWWMKYTVFNGLGKTGEVALEWQFAELITTYNCAMEADAQGPCYLTNASVYSRYSLSQTVYRNNHEPQSAGKTFNSRTKYFTLYLGDYDSSAWLKQHVPVVWNDPARGTQPLMWGFNPNLANRVPMVFDYLFETMTDKDYIVTGDSGAGYANPSALLNTTLREGRKSGRSAWIRYNAPYLERFDIDVCGFLLNGSQRVTRDVWDMYSEMFPGGSFVNGSSLTVYGDVPFVPLSQDVYSYTELSTMYDTFRNTGNNFCAYRTICWKASDLVSLIERCTDYFNSKNDGYTYEYVDPYTLFSLVRESGQGTRYQ